MFKSADEVNELSVEMKRLLLDVVYLKKRNFMVKTVLNLERTVLW